MSAVSSEPQPTLVRFICCTQSYAPGVIPDTFDEEGFIICPQHKQRRYGWKSARKTPYVSHPPALDSRGQKVMIECVNWSEKPLERDRAVVGDLFPALTDEHVLAVSGSIDESLESYEAFGPVYP